MTTETTKPLTKDEIIDFLLSKSIITPSQPCILTIGFNNGHCDISSLKLTSFDQHEIDAMGFGYNKPEVQTVYKATAYYTIAIMFADNEDDLRSNIKAAIDKVVDAYVTLVSETATIYTAALGRVIPLINVNAIL